MPLKLKSNVVFYLKHSHFAFIMSKLLLTVQQLTLSAELNLSHNNRLSDKHFKNWQFTNNVSKTFPLVSDLLSRLETD